MLKLNALNPVLLVSFDVLEPLFAELVSGLSASAPAMSQVEIAALARQASALGASDIVNFSLRVPIILADVIGVQHVGTTSNTRKTVFYDAGDVALANETNAVTVRLEMKSALSTLSSSADLFYALADSDFMRFHTAPRASFFSPNFSFFNGYLTGINRVGSAGVDKEILTLTFERALDNATPDAIAKAPQAAASAFLPDLTL